MSETLNLLRSEQALSRLLGTPPVNQRGRTSSAALHRTPTAQ
jgi:hypothetical protein